MNLESSISTSYSDRKLELIKQRWIQLLLNWLNRCVHAKTPVTKLNYRSLLDVICKYKHDICDDGIQKSILDSDDMELFIRCNYPLLKLKYLRDGKHSNKKLYILTSALLYHCCVSSIDGSVDSDICAHLNRTEQRMILKYCERLTDMVVTINNVDCAIIEACESLRPVRAKRQPGVKIVPNKYLTTSLGAACQTLDATIKPSVSWSLSKLSPSSSSESSKYKKLRLDSSNTVLPSAMTETSFYSESEYVVNYDSIVELTNLSKTFETAETQISRDLISTQDFIVQSTSSDFRIRDMLDCMNPLSCPPDPCSDDSKSRKKTTKKTAKKTPKKMSKKTIENNCQGDTSVKSMAVDLLRAVKEVPVRLIGNLNYINKSISEEPETGTKKLRQRLRSPKVYIPLIILGALLLLMLLLFLIWDKPWKSKAKRRILEDKKVVDTVRTLPAHSKVYVCRNNTCQIGYASTTDKTYLSMSRCILKCMGPQIWPHPTGFTFYNKKVVALATSQLEYKFQSIPSESVLSYLAQALKVFIRDLVRLEKSHIKFDYKYAQKDISVRKMNIKLNVESDPDPRIRVDTEETYNLIVDVINNVLTITITSPSFCGVRHGLETLSQLILTDPITGYLITLSNVVITDGPSYKYRGLMIDTGRNYIPVPDLMRTIDAMATCKLNTFHWRISDVTSFPLLLPSLPQLFEYGGYDRTLVYTKEDVKAIVKKARIRGIRVLIEVAAPGPVGRAWSWSSDVSCPTNATNSSCNNYLCLRLVMRGCIMNVLQTIYSEIIEMTNVEDVFHLSDSLFTMVNCYHLTEDREGFLERALKKLKVANKGCLPKLPIIWYTKHLSEDIKAKCWDRLGVQLTELQPAPMDRYPSKYKIIHSSKWDLSCQVQQLRCLRYRTWQNMYSWKPWSIITAFTTEGGESILWTDLVDSANLDIHIWPRAAAVAERLWSDTAINNSVSPSVYIRLDNYRWRLILRSVKVQPIWPIYCSSNPEKCLSQLRP